MQDGWLIFRIIWHVAQRKKVIDSGWTLSGIKDAIALDLDSLPAIDPVHDIAPMIADPSGIPPIPIHAVYDLSPEVKSIGYSRDAESSDEEEVWSPEDDRNIFNVLDKFEDDQWNIVCAFVFY